MTSSLLVLAQLGGAGSPYSSLFFIGGIFLIMYFLMIRPQQKQMREHKLLVSALKKGDDVVTQSGLLGKVHAVTDKFITLEIANGVRVRMLKTAVQGKTALTEEAAAPAGKVEEKREEK
ncbi:MAG: preprotein translocase subunit YajC [Myxococcaceae bacterium]